MEMGAGTADIARMIPEVRGWLPDISTPLGLESEQTRFRSFDSFASFLKKAAQRRPHMLILDDLHWADTPSLLLLQFIVREVSGNRLLIVGTYRDLGFGRAHPLAQALGEIVHEPCSQSVTLRGLSEHDVARFIEGATAQPPAATLVAAVYKITDGNPFFLTEVVRLLCDAGNQSLIPGSRSGIAIPQGVRAAVGQRLLMLSAECQQALTLAAVIGREFDVEVLQGMKASLTLPAGDRFLEMLEEAVAARIIAEVLPSVGRYSFSHALIRETLYEELSQVRRVRLHRQIAEVLERRYVHKPESHLAELAYHFFQAAEGGRDADKAIRYATQAGEQAMAVLAYEDAVLHYQRALQILELEEANGFQRCELLLSLGAAQRKAGDIAAARDTCQRAAAVARQLGAPREVSAACLARAALGFGGDAWIEYGTVDEPLVALLEEALEVLDPSGSVLRARISGRLAVALFYFADGRERRAVLSQQAVEMARRVGDTATLAYALNSRHWALWSEANVEERLAIATEIVRLAEQAGARELAMTGHAWRIADLLELGEITAVDREIATFAQLAAVLRQPLYLWWTLTLQGMRALLDGRFMEAERLAQQAVAMGQQIHPQAPARVFGLQFVNLRRQQGRLAELETAMTQLLAQRPMPVASQQIGLALLYSDLGREVEARREFAAVAAHGFVDLPRDQTWLINFALLAQVCAFLGDTRHAATLYECLLPYRRQTIVGGNVTPIVCLGAVSRFLGLLATTLSYWDEAESHFATALAMNTRLGARPYVAHTQHEYACMLLARNQSGDSEKAQDLLDLALATARELGMRGLEEKIKLSVVSCQSPDESSQDSVVNDQHSALSTQHSPVFRREGAFWTLAYQGHVCRLKDAKGLHYIATLLRSPGQEFHVIDLMARVTPQPTPSLTALPARLAAEHLHVSGPDAGGNQLDAQARVAYRRRLKDLQDELEEAERFHDSGRAAQARAEIDFLTSELAAAYDLRGRARKRGSSSEKARQAVSYCIRSSLNKIRTIHPLLWRHLFTALKTGTFCSYNPEHSISWEV
jgi:predicted ATPase